MYCTVADITAARIPEATLISLTDDANVDAVDEAVVAAIIADSDELIDGFLRGRYLLPLDPVPGMIRALSLDISTYNLYGRKPEFEMPKTVSERYAAAIASLKLIQKGDVVMGSAGVEAPAAPDTSFGMETKPNVAMFGDDVLARF